MHPLSLSHVDLFKSSRFFCPILLWASLGYKPGISSGFVKFFHNSDHLKPMAPHPPFITSMQTQENHPARTPAQSLTTYASRYSVSSPRRNAPYACSLYSTQFWPTLHRCVQSRHWRHLSNFRTLSLNSRCLPLQQPPLTPHYTVCSPYSTSLLA